MWQCKRIRYYILITAEAELLDVVGKYIDTRHLCSKVVSVAWNSFARNNNFYMEGSDHACA